MGQQVSQPRMIRSISAAIVCIGIVAVTVLIAASVHA